jgi:hypothetical protein
MGIAGAQGHAAVKGLVSARTISFTHSDAVDHALAALAGALLLGNACGDFSAGTNAITRPVAWLLNLSSSWSVLT